MRILLLTFLMMFSVFSAISASPMAPMPEINIEGIVASISWVPEQTVPGIPGMSGSLGGERTFKASYKLTLTDCDVTYSSKDLTPEELKMYREVKTGKVGVMALTLDHAADDNFLIPGMKIRIEGYDESGDEGGIWTKFRNIEIIQSATDVVENDSQNCKDCYNK